MSSPITGSAAFRVADPADSRDGRVPREEEATDLFDRYRDPLLPYLFSLGLTPADGEEVIQEVFLSLFQNLQRGKCRGNLRLKRYQRTRRDLEAHAGAGSEDCATDPGPTPEDRLIKSESPRRVWAVIQALPEQDRRCLSLRAEGLHYREIADVPDMSLGAVSISLARSLARISHAAER